VVLEELRVWLANPQPATFPYDAVVAEFRRCGKHFVGEPLLETLTAARDTPAAGADLTLRRFLEVALDKRDGRYDYPTYTGLCLLPIPSVEDLREGVASALEHRDRLAVQLVADLLEFELAARAGRTSQLPKMRPDARTVRKRCQHGLRVALPALERLGLAGGVTADDPQVAAAQLAAVAQRELTSGERRALALSMLPVYVLHDEYLFIRVLQVFETTFALLACELSEAVRAVMEGEGPTAIERVARADVVLRESAPLFSLLGTMGVESFRWFRQYTDGASAIQSRNYKLMESLCRVPDPERLDSAAYMSTPDIRERVMAGTAALDDAVERARAARRLNTDELTQLVEAMGAFSETLKRWRQTHYRLAVRMLGNDSIGTGQTPGSPYLAAVRNIDVFRSIARPGKC
jgi:tryptophan 2,3-dioxygenase